MRVFVILSALMVAAVSASGNECYSQAHDACQPGIVETALGECNSLYGHFINIQSDLRAYANLQIEGSFHYLLMSVYYGTYAINREGLQTYFRKLSDRAWEDGIDLIKFITKRGGHMEVKCDFSKPMLNATKTFELNELTSLAQALDIQKQMAKKALHIYDEALTHKSHSSHSDGSIAHYFEERFIEPQADRVRSLAGHVTELKKLLVAEKSSVGLFIFDEYLKKSL